MREVLGVAGPERHNDRFGFDPFRAAGGVDVDSDLLKH